MYLRARFNHSLSNPGDKISEVLPTLPSVQTSDLQHSSYRSTLQDILNAQSQPEHYSSRGGTGCTATSVNEDGGNCLDEGNGCSSSGERAVHWDLIFGSKSNPEIGSHHGDSYSCASHHSQCSCKHSDDTGRILHGCRIEECGRQTCDNSQKSMLRSASLCQNHVTGLKEKDDNVTVPQNNETVSRVTNNCLIRTHSAENVTRNISHCSKSNCNCSIDSFPSTQIQMHATDSEQFQKHSQTGCRERSKSVDMPCVQRFSPVRCFCGVHNHPKGQNCETGDCLHYASSLSNLATLEYPVVDSQELTSQRPLSEFGCQRNLNDVKLHGVGSDEFFKKHDFKYARLAESVRTFTVNSVVSSELKTGSNCGTPSPLSSLRLQPTRHHTKSAILSILESGEVCIEFLRKKRGNKEDRVVDVCRISGDGLRIVLYRPNGGLGCAVGDSPPGIPEEGADAIYSFESLPAKHWKKYVYASRFVNLVKAKTPKVTFYSDKAKCLLMENDPDPDFEACFYEGGKITKVSGECIKIIDSSGHSTTLKDETCEHSLSSSARLLWDHFRQCYHHCKLLECHLTQISNKVAVKGANYFPIIVGKRPSVFGGKENVASIKAEKQMSHIPVMSSCDVSVVSTIPTKHCGSAVQHGQNITPSSRGASPSSSHLQSLKTIKAFVPGVGMAVQLPSGEVQVHHNDGSVVTINCTSSAVELERPGGQIKQYGEKDVLPDDLKMKLMQIPKVMRYLMKTDGKIKSPVLTSKTNVIR
ncbi:hypothetical protein B7P43_G08540 [Cryptotermes secundus]|uniref:Uncharacterized protein n=3 Tax=Cryptotermes secundus TaxID=105785 RepID=A0A2J7QET2_9NEOP|nr:hypothetical protein B7P43_G08540 [Cryptotermes secundus]